MKTVVGTVLALTLSAMALPAWAGDAVLGDLRIEGAWARATPPRAPAGGAFLTVTNGGAAADTLLSVSAGVSRTVELHTHVHEGDVMRMQRVPAIEVPAGQSVALAPGGFHIMLIGLNQPLAEGGSFPLELTFAKAGKVTVTVDVQPLGAMAPSMPMKHDPAMHEQHMKDPEHKAMHERMHGKEN
jgi:Uncharacterized protein conserved in bacteria